MGAPGSQASLREANSGRIVEAVKLYGKITQVELAAATGLSPATVSNIVKQLLAAGIVQTSITTRSGRRAQQVSLVRSSELSVGVHIGRRAAEVIVADASYSVNARQSFPLPADHRHDTTLDRIALLVAELTEQLGASLDDVDAVGVALPARTGLPAAAGLPGWEDVRVEAVLERRLRRGILVTSEAEAAAVAESRYGSLRGVTTGLLVRASHNVDGCILLEGLPHRGVGGIAGALGHVRVDASGPICRCGARGCLNTVVTSDAMAEDLRVSHGPMGLRAIVAAARAGDPGCRQVVADAAAVVGGVVADAAMLLGPECVTIAGELAAAGDVFCDPIREALASRPLLSRAIVVRESECQDPEARGALALAHDAVSPSLMTQEV
ncbi:ROK family transcriptional regulator [Tessaracoccus antarcticus]|nr:ROK family transcriptional regulator [Tessaracoccus antarcticus]